MTGDLSGVDQLLQGAADDRQRRQARAAQIARTASIAVTIGWLAFVVLGGHVGRVLNAWPSTLTMIAGSFVAGSTPQGGGAVAFPVFTKILETPSELARTMGLCIQTFGMGMASFGILVQRRPVSWRAYGWTIAGAAIGFGTVLAFFTDWDAPYAPSTLDGAWVRVTFTVVVTSLGIHVARRVRSPLNHYRLDLPPRVPAMSVLLFAFGIGGGALAALSGSGADVTLFVGASLILALDPRRAIPTSVMVMATLSVVGFIVFGLLDGQLDVVLQGDHVALLDGRTVSVIDGALSFSPDGALPERLRYDLFGLLLAAVPVVIWFAPVGAKFAAQASSTTLAVFIASLAAAEFISTVIFLDRLRSEPALAAYLVLGTLFLVLAVAGLAAWAQRALSDPGERDVRLREQIDTSRKRLDTLGGDDR